MRTLFCSMVSVWMTLLIQSCAMVDISISEKRNPTPQKIILGENILSTWGTIKVNKSHFFPSSFQLKADDKIIYIDPVGIETDEKADYILLTHSHPDHFSIRDIEKITKSETKIICSKGVAKKLKDYDPKVQVVRPNDTIILDDIEVEATPAYNTKSVFLWIKAHSKSKKNVGFVVTLNKGLRIYHAGDTDYISEMKDIENIHLALVPIGGDNLTMNEEEAARMVKEIKPKKVVPMHYEIKNQEALKHFKNLVPEDIEVIVME